MGSRTNRIARAARKAILPGLVAVACAFRAFGLEADLLQGETVSAPIDERLSESGKRKADAIAQFARGIFEEETMGPEAALESFKKTLALDPGYVDLALKVSQDYLRQGDTASAISILKDSRKKLPENADLSLALALIYLRQLQKVDLATQFALAARKAAPDAVGPLEILAEIYATRGESSKTAAMLARATESKTDDPQYWLGLADLTARRGVTGPSDREAARERVLSLLGRAMANASGDAESLARAGDLYALSRDVEKAVAAYEAAYEIKANLPKLRDKMAAGYSELGQTEKAIDMLGEMISLNPLDLASYDKLAQLHLRAGDLSKAAASAKQALIMEPQSLDRHLFVIDLLFRDNDFGGAADALAEARKLFPGTPRLAYFLGLALTQSKKPDAALKAFAEALDEGIKYDPDLLDAKFYFDYGAAADLAGDRELAARHFKTSIDKDPDSSAQACNYLGYMWVEAGTNFDQAEQYIRRALAQEADNGAYIDSLGWLYFKQGKYDESLATLLRAAEHLPEPDPVVFAHIGDACEKLGRTAEATLYWRKALDLDPNDEKIAAKLDAARKTLVQQPDKTDKAQ